MIMKTQSNAVKKTSKPLSLAPRERVLEVAENLFSQHGYAAIKMRDIADALGVRQASLYYHAPEGKAQLFFEATKQSLLRHKSGLEQTIAAAEPDVHAQLLAAARWSLSQPQVDFNRLMGTDTDSLSKSQVRELGEMMEAALFRPIEKIFTGARKRGEIKIKNSETMAGTFLTVLQAVHHSHRYTQVPKDVIAAEIIGMLLNGLYPR
ncbi:MAG: TetR/AcrR family transcriptional regulator [Rhizobacter sp.]|nr:TetR/AcrR family transcriptional regulator [Chlorobiales bacterium]